MDKKTALKLLRSLPADTGLTDAENWDDGPDSQQWRKDAIEAIKFAVKALTDGNIVGTIEINGKTYTIVE